MVKFIIKFENLLIIVEWDNSAINIIFKNKFFLNILFII